MNRNKPISKMKTIFIFIPDTLEKDNIGILEGFLKYSNDNLTFYITNDKLLNSSSKNIGYCSENTPEGNLTNTKGNSEWIHINNKTGTIKVNGLNLKNAPNVDDKITSIGYDYNAFKNLDITTFKCQNYGEHFETLAKAVQANNTLEFEANNHGPKSIFQLLFILVLNLILLPIDVILKLYQRLDLLLHYSATAVHLNTCATTFKWALTKVKQERKLTLSVGNAIVSRIADFLCGLALLYLVLQYEAEFIIFLQNTTESIIHGLEQLLNFLMGSPVGLKLNYAFNKTLGTFFLYHISLWRAFLHSASPLLRLGLHLLVIPGAFGLSFQAALLSDLVAFSTFHVYCIYVYAARLYGVQIRGLISLWRLFIGRKYNPLRQRVDSLQYTHHQLFIGTLGFTVLLFLLPTTFLYYAVFTVFRICLITLDGILIRLRYIFQCLPLYVSTLWMINSPSVKGAIKLIVQNKSSPNTPTVHATLQTLSVWQSIVNSVPCTLGNIPSVSWSLLFRSVATGLLL